MSSPTITDRTMIPRLSFAMRETAKGGARLFVALGRWQRHGCMPFLKHDSKRAAAVGTSRELAWSTAITAARVVGAPVTEWHADLIEVPTTLGVRTSRLRMKLEDCRAVVLTWSAYEELAPALERWSCHVDVPTRSSFPDAR